MPDDSPQDADGVLRQLREIKDRAPHVSSDFETTMQDCTDRVVPGAAEWFLTEITPIANSDADALLRWNDLIRPLILRAAARQIPASTSADALRAWKTLLLVPRSATIALVALTETSEDRLRLLDTWWKSNPPDRARSLKEILAEAHATLPSSALLEELRQRRDNWPTDLQEAVNTALHDKFKDPIFEPTTQPVST